MTAQAPPALAARTGALPGAIRHRRVRLEAGTPTAARAAAAVRAMTEEWQLPVDRALAAVLASDLVISTAVSGTGENLMLSVHCTATQFRVEVHDASVRGDSGKPTHPGPERHSVACCSPPHARPTQRPLPNPAAGRVLRARVPAVRCRNGQRAVPRGSARGR